MVNILIFLLAIIAANLSVAYFGPISAPFNALILIGLDLSLRDKIHEKWHSNSLGLKMLGLICIGAVVAYILNQGAGRIALASVIAFIGALAVDSIVYEWLFKKTKLTKMNGSNTASALVDSVLFPTIAFGVFMPWIVLGQFLAKVVGGAIWAFILTRKTATQ